MINSRDINDLHETLQRGVIELISRMKKHGYNMGISATYRDDEYQDYLYEQGRTRPGAIVTNAKGGESIHNYRLAFDVFNNVSGNLYPDDFLKKACDEWVEMGGVCGANWTSFPDRPHMEYTGDLNLKLLQSGATLPDDEKMLWEENESIETPTYQNFNVGGKVFKIESTNKNDRVYVKARDLLESINYNVTWDDSKKIVNAVLK